MIGLIIAAALGAAAGRPLDKVDNGSRLPIGSGRNWSGARSSAKTSGARNKKSAGYCAPKRSGGAANEAPPIPQQAGGAPGIGRCCAHRAKRPRHAGQGRPPMARMASSAPGRAGRDPARDRGAALRTGWGAGLARALAAGLIVPGGAYAIVKTATGQWRVE